MTAKPVRHTATHAQMRQWAAQLVTIEQELHKAGMHVTARAANRTVRAIGWEFSGDLTTADLVSRTETP